MKTITVSIGDSCYAAIEDTAKTYGQQPEELASEIITRCLQGDDARREIRLLRDDLSVLAQVILVKTKAADEEAARVWVTEELRLNR